ncbi:hypothetical protein AGMMS49992_17490 [Clostridia bacterium]|nr:hypothetical protein AGMMS49992_17490 [Clostridia bacterium]
MKFDQFLVKPDNTIIDVMSIIERNKKRAALVINDSIKIIGFVSQGDILRSVVNGVNLYSHIEAIMSSSFKYMKLRDMDVASDLFKNMNISLLPIVDDDFQLLDLITITDIIIHLEGKKA